MVVDNPEMQQNRLIKKKFENNIMLQTSLPTRSLKKKLLNN